MPDNETRHLQHVSLQDTVLDNMYTTIFNDANRTILADIGFLQGGIHTTHDLEIGMYICDDFANFVDRLRCFESDSISYSFVGFPCDSTWVLSNVENVSQNDIINFYPNPTSNNFTVSRTNVENSDIKIQIFDGLGNVVKLININSHGSFNIDLENLPQGLYYIEIWDKRDRMVKRIIKY